MFFVVMEISRAGMKFTQQGRTSELRCAHRELRGVDWISSRPHVALAIGL